MTIKELSGLMIIIGSIFWIAETWYFGWNKYPSSKAEEVCDWISNAIIVLGIAARLIYWESLLEKLAN